MSNNYAILTVTYDSEYPFKLIARGWAEVCLLWLSLLFSTKQMFIYFKFTIKRVLKVRTKTAVAITKLFNKLVKKCGAYFIS